MNSENYRIVCYALIYPIESNCTNLGRWKGKAVFVDKRKAKFMYSFIHTYMHYVCMNSFYT